jgi:GNAT superfamily N-acetyltransferase
MSIQVVPLKEEHLTDAAALVSRRYQGLRTQVPTLPPRYAEIDTLLPLLRDITAPGPGVAAMERGRLAGFLAGWLIPSFRGKRSAFSPEWANGADLADSRHIYEEMYTQLAAAWLAEGYGTHLMGMLVNDRDGLAGWHWSGFGMIAADAVRDLRPVQGRDMDVDIRRAGLGDLEQLTALDEALHRYLAASPTFLPHEEEHERRYYEEWLQDPAKAVWLAYQGSEAVGYIGLGPASEDASTIIRDAKTTSVEGAFTREHARGGGIGTALLRRALEWARDADFERCATDFEPMNPLATRFWLRHFEPVCYTLIRHL